MRPTINYSPTRDNVNNFNAILDRVEERIDRFSEKVKIIETDDSAFNEEFPGIIDFLYEASDLPENSEKRFEKRFIYFEKAVGYGYSSNGVLSLISIFVIRLHYYESEKIKFKFKEINIINYNVVQGLSGLR